MKIFILVLFAFFAVPVLAQDRVSKYDLNDDNKVDYEELFAVCDLRKTLFDKADKNKDGSLTNTEMREGRAYLFRSCNKQEKKEA